MTPLSALAKIAALAGAVERAGKAIAQAWRGLRQLPRPRVPPREESQPLSHAAVEHQQAQIRSARPRLCPRVPCAHWEPCPRHGEASPRAVTRDPRETILPPRKR